MGGRAAHHAAQVGGALVGPAQAASARVVGDAVRWAEQAEAWVDSVWFGRGIAGKLIPDLFQQSIHAGVYRCCLQVADAFGRDAQLGFPFFHSLSGGWFGLALPRCPWAIEWFIEYGQSPYTEILTGFPR